MVCSAEAKEAAFGGSTTYAAFPLIAQQLKRAVVRLGPVGLFAGIWAAVITAVFRVVGLFRGGLTEVLPCSIGTPFSTHARMLGPHAWTACVRTHARRHAKSDVVAPLSAVTFRYFSLVLPVVLSVDSLLFSIELAGLRRAHPELQSMGLHERCRGIPTAASCPAARLQAAANPQQPRNSSGPCELEHLLPGRLCEWGLRVGGG